MTTIRTKIYNYLKSRPGQLVTTSEIISAVYGEDHPVDKYSMAKVRAHMTGLRYQYGDDKVETVTSYKFKN